jgi:hypothetical protein
MRSSIVFSPLAWSFKKFKKTTLNYVLEVALVFVLELFLRVTFNFKAFCDAGSIPRRVLMWSFFSPVFQVKPLNLAFSYQFIVVYILVCYKNNSVFKLQFIE